MGEAFKPAPGRIVHRTRPARRLELAPARFALAGRIVIILSTSGTNDHCVFIAFSFAAVKLNADRWLTYLPSTATSNQFRSKVLPEA
jgi:hypothetical protein